MSNFPASFYSFFLGVEGLEVVAKGAWDDIDSTETSSVHGFGGLVDKVGVISDKRAIEASGRGKETDSEVVNIGEVGFWMDEGQGEAGDEGTGKKGEDGDELEVLGHRG